MRRRAGALADGVAPRNPLVGVMLAYTPLHHLLLRATGPLVMTSGNRSDEPIAFEDRDALERLRDIADVIVTHDRPIHTRCDDSVGRVVGGAPVVLRRARGFTPHTLELMITCDRPVLALGGHLKSTFAFGVGDRALLGHHIGDLDDHRAYASYVQAIEHYERVFEISPELVVHDLHPDYGSTRYALDRRGERIAVQHHHAHIASCMAEHGLTEPVIGVALDGSGYGTDGALWGGEFLVADLRSFERAAHLRYVPLPGGEAAIREPWRMALSHLVDAERSADLDVSPASVRLVRQMIDRGIHSPPTSSIGRLFDAVAALAGVRQHVSFEGQAAMELEWLAMTVPSERGYAFDCGARIIDARPVIHAVVDDRRRGISPARIARRFHEAVIDLIGSACSDLRDASNHVVLSGGVFQNAIITSGAVERLTAQGFVVHRHREVPPNDGGLALGQLAIAAARGR